jgi:hypothetical protein
MLHELILLRSLVVPLPLLLARLTILGIHMLVLILVLYPVQGYMLQNPALLNMVPEVVSYTGA